MDKVKFIQKWTENYTTVKITSKLGSIQRAQSIFRRRFDFEISTSSFNAFWTPYKKIEFQRRFDVKIGYFDVFSTSVEIFFFQRFFDVEIARWYKVNNSRYLNLLIRLHCFFLTTLFTSCIAQPCYLYLNLFKNLNMVVQAKSS